MYMLLNHNGKDSYEYDHYAHVRLLTVHLTQSCILNPLFMQKKELLDQLQGVLNTLTEQAKEDGRLLSNGSFDHTWKQPDNYPVTEITSTEWELASPQKRLETYKNSKAVVIRGHNPAIPYNLHDDSHLASLVGDLNKLRTIHGEYSLYILTFK
jgi:hypothetical protein